MASFLSALNSSVTALDNGQAFTGSWEDVGNYDSIVVSMVTDQNGTYSVQFSPDATNVDSTLTRYYRTSQINVPHRFTVARRWMRVVFTNDSGSNQTFFRMQTLIGDKSNLNIPIDGTVAQDYDATAVRPTDYHYEVAQGLRQGHVTFNKFGYNLAVGSTATETIWAPGGTYTPPTSATALDIVSSTTNDSTGGTGARLLMVTGVDANRKTQTETFNLNGTTTITSTTTWLGINRAAVASAGSGQENDGTITITADTGGATLAQIPAGDGTTQQCIYHVQLQSKALADWLWVNVNKISAGNQPVVTVKGKVFNPTANCWYEVFRMNIDTTVENTVSLNPEQPFVLSPGDVFLLEADTTLDNTVVTARFSLIEIQDASYDPDA